MFIGKEAKTVINYFKNDDHGFSYWLRSNPDGYVFDDFVGPNPQNRKLHQSGCRQVRSPASLFLKTRVRKVCCSNLDELVHWIDKNIGPEDEVYFPCNNCRPFQARENNLWNG
jgi:hypothetical protein